MSNVPSSYFTVKSKVKPIMEAIQKAGIPEKFTLSFLNSIGFKSTNDRPIIAVLKSLGFLNESGVPTQVYRDYKDGNKAKKVLARQMREAYSGIFLADENAHKLGVDKLKGTFASLTGKGDSVASKMAATFKALANIADFSNDITSDNESDLPTFEGNKEKKPEKKLQKTNSTGTEFHYNIQIHLPVTNDISVYNAVFKSLKEHLME